MNNNQELSLEYPIENQEQFDLMMQSPLKKPINKKLHLLINLLVGKAGNAYYWFAIIRIKNKSKFYAKAVSEWMEKDKILANNELNSLLTGIGKKETLVVNYDEISLKAEIALTDEEMKLFKKFNPHLFEGKILPVIKEETNNILNSEYITDSHGNIKY